MGVGCHWRGGSVYKVPATQAWGPEFGSAAHTQTSWAQWCTCVTTETSGPHSSLVSLPSQLRVPGPGSDFVSTRWGEEHLKRLDLDSWCSYVCAHTHMPVIQHVHACMHACAHAHVNTHTHILHTKKKVRGKSNLRSTGCEELVGHIIPLIMLPYSVKRWPWCLSLCISTVSCQQDQQQVHFKQTVPKFLGPAWGILSAKIQGHQVLGCIRRQSMIQLRGFQSSLFFSTYLGSGWPPYARVPAAASLCWLGSQQAITCWQRWTWWLTVSPGFCFLRVRLELCKPPGVSSGGCRAGTRNTRREATLLLSPGFPVSLTPAGAPDSSFWVFPRGASNSPLKSGEGCCPLLQGCSC